MLDAVVLASSANTGSLRDCSSEPSEAMIRIGERPMVRYVVDALLKSKNIRNIIITGPAELRNVFFEENVKVVEAEGSVIQNLMEGLSCTRDSDRVLIATSDIPLLTPKAVDDFIISSSDMEIDLFYPIVKIEHIRRQFPEIKRTFVQLKDGTFTGGNLFIVNPQVVENCAAKASEFISYRKSPAKMCRLLGIRFVIKLFFKVLTISEIEKKVSDLFGIKARAVLTSYPEIGIDVDKPSDFLTVSNYLVKPD